MSAISGSTPDATNQAHRRHMFNSTTYYKNKRKMDKQAEKIVQRISEIPVREIEVSAIHSDGENPNRMGDERFAGLVQHIRDHGILNPIIVTESMLIADGEHRLKAAKEIGLTSVPCRVIPDDDRLRRILRQTMNKLRGTHDDALDAEEYKHLIDEDGIIALATYLGEDSGEMLRVLDRVISTPATDPEEFDVDAAVAAVETPVTKLGDVIGLGDHVLICGDATSKETWDKLLSEEMGGGDAEMMITDPPYNVGYVGATERKLTIMNDKMPEDKFRDFLHDFLVNAMEHVRGAQYVFMSISEWSALNDSFAKAGGVWSTTIIWVKRVFTLSRKDFHPQYEPLYVGTVAEKLKKCKRATGQPILYGWRKGGKRQHHDNRTEGDVWITDKPLRNEIHPTMKPVSLYRKAMLLSSSPLDIVVDPFCGSGTAIIAAEQTHRKARCMELDPVYCDVIIKRWEEFTGKRAERL